MTCRHCNSGRAGLVAGLRRRARLARGPGRPGKAGSRGPPLDGPAYYDIYFLADDGSGDWLFHTITNETSATTPPIGFVGSAHLTVKAIAPLAAGSQGSFMTPISQTSVTVTFTR